MFLEDLERVLAEARALLASPASLPERLSGAQAFAAAESVAEAERLFSSAKLRYARRAEAEGALARRGWTDPSSWLGAVSGTPKGQTRGALEAAAALEQSPSAAAAFARGELSAPQAVELAKVAGKDEAAAQALVELARDQKTPFFQFRQAAERAEQHLRDAESDAGRDARLHDRRHLRYRKTDSGVEGSFFLPTAMGARLVTALEARKEHFFKSASQMGERDTSDHYLADALVSLVLGAQKIKGDGPATTVHVHVSAAALRTGALGADDVCEIPGFGPISVAQAKDLMGDCFYHSLIDDGIDVYRISTEIRNIREPVRRALESRDPCCAVPGCDMTVGLQIHHFDEEYHLGGPTELKNLVRVCRRHHAAMSAHQMRLVGGPGTWRYLAETRPFAPVRDYSKKRGPATAKNTSRRAVTARVRPPTRPPRVLRG